ncbi:unnamed protein product [Arctia plantaginis]|uniref:Uncharacterized protein n=1 Tax=Arctia plantaginis TaxID=874455 RepID=A0A8S0YRW9_ARCPL|nr:unnamed protein product [Arctia plantaginis]
MIHLVSCSTSSVFESVQEPTLRQLPSRLMIEEERSKSEYEEKSIAFIGARRQPGALTRDKKEHKDGLEPENDPVTIYFSCIYKEK